MNDADAMNQETPKRHRIVVVGGGAAGFFAAITAKETNPKAEVTILERSPNVLGKVKISGGGRCNVTHACFDPKELVKFYPRGGKALLGAFHRFHAQNTVEWFAARGVRLKTEADGRMFPTTDNSETIIQCLTESARQAGVKVWTQCGILEVRKLDSPSPTYALKLTNGQYLEANAVLMATGSNATAWKLVGTLGHSIEPPVPSLFTFNIQDERLVDLAGVSVPNAKVHIQGTKRQAEGALLITHWGMSGPAILRLSAWGARDLAACQYQFRLVVNWIPTYTAESAFEMLQQLKAQSPKKQIFTQSNFALPSRLWRKLVGESGIFPEKRWADIPKTDLRRLAEQLTQGIYEVKGKSTNKDEFVTCGGVKLKEVDFKTMESRLHKGLYFAGEILDVDAITGGFNFQNAWTTGYLAGLAMANPI